MVMDELVEQLIEVQGKIVSMNETSEELIKLKNNINHFLLLHCNHELVDDYIDISPDESIPICYCNRCGSLIKP
jgi:hypothetical protein